jgi:hypothetical protein
MRKYFFDKSLLYLFSYNTEIDPYTQTIGVSPEGVRFNENATDGDSRVYHVMRERSEGGLSPAFRVITGNLKAGFDRALYRTDDVIVGDVRLTIETDDGALIGGRYRATAYLGYGGYDAYVAGIDKVGSRREPVQSPIVITPRYETDAKDYKWIMDYQCIGFGRADVVKNQVRRVTYDIYAMT